MQDVDYEKMLDLFDGDRAQVNAMLEKFLLVSQRHINEAVAACSSMDAVHLGRVAHSMVGAGGFIGAERFSRTAQLLEDACKCSDFDRACVLIRELGEVIQEISRLISGEA